MHEPLRCPVCRAPWKDGDSCYRCRSDLTFLRLIMQKAGGLRKRARALVSEERLEEAQRLLDESLRLFTGREGISLKAYILALEGKFELLAPLLELLTERGGPRTTSRG